MNAYTMETIREGMSASFTVTVQPAWFDQFRDISGDDNPLHTDRGYAMSCGYEDNVLYGMCTASLYSRLCGVYLPGKYCLLQECETAFVAPVYAGEELTVTGTVKEVDERFGRIIVRAEIRNAQGKKVSRAVLRCGFVRPQQTDEEETGC